MNGTPSASSLSSCLRPTRRSSSRIRPRDNSMLETANCAGLSSSFCVFGFARKPVDDVAEVELRLAEAREVHLPALDAQRVDHRRQPRNGHRRDADAPSCSMRSSGPSPACPSICSPCRRAVSVNGLKLASASCVGGRARVRRPSRRPSGRCAAPRATSVRHSTATTPSAIEHPACDRRKRSGVAAGVGCSSCEAPRCRPILTRRLATGKQFVRSRIT